MATSGWRASTMRSSASASPQRPATSKPASSSSRARPSRSSASSSAITTRTASPGAARRPRRPPFRRRRRRGPDLRHRGVERGAGADHEPQATVLGDGVDRHVALGEAQRLDARRSRPPTRPRRGSGRSGRLARHEPRRLLGQLVEGGAEPLVGEDRREQAMGDVAQLDDRGAHALLGLGRGGRPARGRRPRSGAAPAGWRARPRPGAAARRRAGRARARGASRRPRPRCGRARRAAPPGGPGGRRAGARARAPGARSSRARTASAGSSSRPGRWTTASTSSPPARTRVVSRSRCGGRVGRRALGVDPLAAVEAVQQLERRIAERVGEPRAQLAGRRRGADVEHEARQGGTRPAGPPAGERHAGGDQRERAGLGEAQRAVRRVVGEEAAIEAVDRVGAEQRHGGDRRDEHGRRPAPPGRRGADDADGREHGERRGPGRRRARARPARACARALARPSIEQQVGRALRGSPAASGSNTAADASPSSPTPAPKPRPRRRATAGRSSGRSSSPRSAAAASSGGQAA